MYLYRNMLSQTNNRKKGGKTKLKIGISKHLTPEYVKSRLPKLSEFARIKRLNKAYADFILSCEFDDYEKLVRKIVAKSNDLGDLSPLSFVARSCLVPFYGFAIPNKELIEKILEMNTPIVEVGAGTGYLAHVLRKAGADIKAFDIAPPSNTVNKFGFEGTWVPVENGDETIVKKYPERTLLLSWPDYNTDFGFNAIANYEGDTLVLIHEGRWGCVGNDRMFDLLDEEWTPLVDIWIPNWYGIHDRATIYRRKDGKARNRTRFNPQLS